jgi:chromosome segregation ATPase
MATIEERLGTLEVRVKNLETWAGPGQASALAEGQRQIRADIARMRLEFTSEINGLKTDFGTLKTDVATLKTDVATLKTDVATLKTDVATLKTDVATLKTDVATLKTDMAEVKETVREILRRLPALPAEA